MDECSSCGCKLGGKTIPFFDDSRALCPKCSGRRAVRCLGCGTEFVDIGTVSCPFCRHPRTAEIL